MSMAIRARRVSRRGSGSLVISWRRIARILALAGGLALVILLQRSFGTGFANHNFFGLYYAYVVLAVLLGGLWEGIGAVVAAIAVSLWVLHVGVVTPWHYSQWTLPGEADQNDWYLFAATSLALAGLAQWRRLRTPADSQTVAPVVSSSVENPVLIVQGHAQILQGGGVVFNTRAGEQATVNLSRAARTTQADGGRASAQPLMCDDSDVR